MLTFLSRLWRRYRAPYLRVVPDLPRDPEHLHSTVRLVPDRDTIAVLAPASIGATAFVAGQGARIYSLSAFRRQGPHRPHAA